MELMTPSGGTIFWTVVTFILLVLILRKVAWRPILQTLDEREKRIRESLEQAEKARIVAQKTMEEQSHIIEKARQDAQEILTTTRKTAEVAREEILTKTGKEAERLLAKAKRDIELSRDKAIEEIREMVVLLSMSATEKIIGKVLDKKEHEALVADFLKSLRESN